MTRPFPYAPKVVIDYLKERVDPSWHVGTEVPANKPDRLVTVTTVPASGPDNMVLSVRRLIIHCWNSDELYCGRMAEAVRALLVGAPRSGAKWIRGVNVVGEPADFRDPDNLAMPRFQLTVDVLLRAHTDANPEALSVGS
mgnify:CR=1 FL=1